MADMYEQQSDSDEDGEVYFLKPVNEYNIVDKIKEANKELFADAAREQQGYSNSALAPESTIKISTTTTTTTTKITTMRKVTFAPNLEDYEPESPTKADNTHFLQADIAASADKLNSNARSELTKFPTIDEEQIEQITMSEDSSVQNVANHNENNDNNNNMDTHYFPAGELTEANNIAQLSAEVSCHSAADDDDVDEICEEIIVMEMERSTTTKTTTTLPKGDSFTAQHKRTILKQATFDCDEQDNKSLMNLLTASDAEDDDSRGTQMTDHDDDHDGNDSSIFIGIDDFDEEVEDDDDDDDQLSLIVASYLPDDFDRAIDTSPSLPNPNSSVKKSHSYFRRSCGKAASACKSPSSFGRRFQLRRKAHSTNSIGTINSGCISASDGERKRDNLTGLKLNYKTCCEYRNSMQGKLPKYTGYLSEYGLSQEQLERREQKLQKKERFVLEQAIKTNENEMQKMQDNERAFTTWLRNKMRFPINKTRNMFDVKLRFTSKKKTTSGNNIAANCSNTSAGPLGCAAKLRPSQ